MCAKCRQAGKGGGAAGSQSTKGVRGEIVTVSKQTVFTGSCSGPLFPTCGTRAWIGEKNKWLCSIKSHRSTHLGVQEVPWHTRVH